MNKEESLLDDENIFLSLLAARASNPNAGSLANSLEWVENAMIKYRERFPKRIK